MTLIAFCKVDGGVLAFEASKWRVNSGMIYSNSINIFHPREIHAKNTTRTDV